ncbi:biotin carboxyl carrier protein [Litorimonas taeanensis]|uniref:Biotin carboxyl carrier protein of acetyl-CoA carboxylase n=1 Tax=Litorimonas taeanensis TaxID=568099 RepID=A0A420WJK9_9PROT|nr:acetyl-CoA carboxylase biotin carboxyl carrier protein [Litorimonas taeanensis]RKQ71095.1 biotin carboxyl carrier protein [Litorimonas taeanensis]
MADTKKSTNSPKPNDIDLVRELADILHDTDLNEIEMKKGDLKIRVSKGGGQVIQAMAAPSAIAPAAAPTPAAQNTAPVSAEPATHKDATTSPMVGTAYVRPSPDADPFVKVGDSVSEGDTILLVEAMKTFNPITAPKSGKVEAIYVDDAQPVEFGEPLFVIV